MTAGWGASQVQLWQSSSCWASSKIRSGASAQARVVWSTLNLAHAGKRWQKAVMSSLLVVRHCHVIGTSLTPACICLTGHTGQDQGQSDLRNSRPRRGSLALVLLHAWAWLEKLFWGPEAGQQARKEKKLFRPQKVLFSIARGRSAGKEGKNTFSGPKKFYFLFYRQRPVRRQGRKKNFSGPKKFYFLSPEAGQQAGKEKKLFSPQKVLFSIGRGRSAGKEGKKTFQAPKSFIFYRQRPVSRQGRKKTFQPPKSFIFYRQRPVSRQGRKKNFSGPQKNYFLSPEARFVGWRLQKQ